MSDFESNRSLDQTASNTGSRNLIKRRSLLKTPMRFAGGNIVSLSHEYCVSWRQYNRFSGDR